ncbi:hypothetical protein COOONC_24147 [Cooperia oncophora]
MLFALIALGCFLVNVNAISNECLTYERYNKWFMEFNENLNRGLIWEPSLMNEICEDLRGIKDSDAEYRYEAERDFSKQRTASLETKLKRTLFGRGPNVKTWQKNIVKKLPLDTKYACNGIEDGTMMKILS